ncbi:hypothetical protein LAZ40_01440 [Cereibacter sphaeroides]|uniref:hypothetical protein n=1 Tax=Cereibacter sphaeroides TaxID=1063 RepID=UPI001F2363C7|nr:hypothetical protein [Cereibacter sphaeroides]MCE6957723.1 hypothetical protein [Cereibacter sphaeroides]MCE6971509.1 hypothetical protein [Cereibacter sphaeroides]
MLPLATLPFPHRIAAISAASAAASLAARRSMRPGDHETPDVAAYRMPDGTVRPAYDLYEPMYPPGAEPGLGRMVSKLEYFPNDTSGYRSHVTDFRPASDLLAGQPEWAAPAIAWFSLHGEQGFVVARSEEELAERLGPPVEGLRTWRRPLKTDDLDPQAPPQQMMIVSALGGTSLFAASSLEALRDLVARRHDWIDLGGGSAEEQLERFEDHARGLKWQVCRQSLPEAEAVCARILATDPNSVAEP